MSLKNRIPYIESSKLKSIDMDNPNLSQEAIDTLKTMHKHGSVSIHKFTVKNELENLGFAVLSAQSKDGDYYKITKAGEKYLNDN